MNPNGSGSTSPCRSKSRQYDSSDYLCSKTCNDGCVLNINNHKRKKKISVKIYSLNLLLLVCSVCLNNSIEASFQYFDPTLEVCQQNVERYRISKKCCLYEAVNQLYENGQDLLEFQYFRT